MWPHSGMKEALDRMVTMEMGMGKGVKTAAGRFRESWQTVFAESQPVYA